MPNGAGSGPTQGGGAASRRITSAEVRAARFGQASHSGGGLSEDEIHAYVDVVAATLEEAEARRDALRAEVRRLRAYYHDQGTDVDQPDTEYDPPRKDPVRRCRRLLIDLASIAQRYAATSTLAPGPAAEQMLAAGARRALEYGHDLLYPPQPVEPPTREQAERMLRWLDSFALAMQIQEREAYDMLAAVPDDRPTSG